MKTIEVSDEQYEMLKEFQNLLKTQDNRFTRDPLYCVMQKKRVYGFDTEYSENYDWYNSYLDSLIDSKEELFDSLNEEEIQELIDVHNANEESIILDQDEKVIKEWFFKKLEEQDYEVESWLEEKNYVKVYYNEMDNISTYSNIFSIFEADAVDYVKSKCYGEDNGNKNNIWSYAESSWRATRMNKIRDFLTEVKL